MEFHPIANCFPLIEGREFKDLVEDIQARGQIEPIVTYKGQVLDGRNRYRACQEIGISVRCTEYDGDDPIGHVIALNLRRRHLNESQRAMVAARLANLDRGNPTGNNQYQRNSANLQNSQVSRAQAAQQLNVSERSVNSAKKVQASGIPDLQKAVDLGETSINAAAKISTLPQEEQKKVVDAKAFKEAAKTVRKAAKEAAIGDEPLPTPTEAKRIAQETGNIVLDSNGKWQTSATQDDVVAGRKWLAIREALETLSNSNLTPEQAARLTPDYRFDHVSRCTEKSCRWLTEFDACLKSRREETNAA